MRKNKIIEKLDEIEGLFNSLTENLSARQYDKLEKYNSDNYGGEHADLVRTIANCKDALEL